jgi:hypothetical protein
MMGKKFLSDNEKSGLFFRLLFFIHLPANSIPKKFPKNPLAAFGGAT